MFGKNKDIENLKKEIENKNDLITSLQNEKDSIWYCGLDNIQNLFKSIEEQLGLELECNIEINDKKITFHNLKLKENK